MARFTGKTVLVTGAARGIGGAIADAFAAEGANVVMTDVLEAELKAHAETIGQTGIVHDVSDEDGWRSVIAAIEVKFGRLDVLVNNAGYGWLKNVTDTSLEEWRKLMSVNVDGVFLGMKHGIPLIAKGGGGAIVNMASMYGTVGNAGTSAYCASKGAVTMMTKAVALECAAAKNGIRVNSIHPGYVSTPSVAETLTTEQVDALRALHPVERLAEPDEIARATLFLASDDASFVVGAQLAVDGGFTTR